MRRSPHGERGLKSIRAASATNISSRSPHGERGLKYFMVILFDIYIYMSLPARGAWIEIVRVAR